MFSPLLNLDLFCNSPDKACEFSGDGHDDFLLGFSSHREKLEPSAETELPLPCDLQYRLWDFQLLVSEQDTACDSCGSSVTPGRLNECGPGMGIPGLGDASSPDIVSAGGFTGDEAEIGHEFSGILKTRDVTDFCDQGGGDDKLDASQRLIGLDHGPHAPLVHLLLNLLGEPSHPFGCGLNGIDVFLTDDLLGGMGESNFREPSHMGRSPGGFSLVPDAVSQQKSFELLPSPAFGVLGVLPCPGEVPNGFVVKPWDVNGREFSCPMEPGEHTGISWVGFYTDAGSFGCHGGGDDDTFEPFAGEMPVDFIPAGSRFIDESEFGTQGLESSHHLIQGFKIPADGAISANLAVSAFISRGDFDGIFVYIESDKHGIVLHSLPPLLRLIIEAFGLNIMALHDHHHVTHGNTTGRQAA